MSPLGPTRTPKPLRMSPITPNPDLFAQGGTSVGTSVGFSVLYYVKAVYRSRASLTLRGASYLLLSQGPNQPEPRTYA